MSKDLKLHCHYIVLIYVSAYTMSYAMFICMYDTRAQVTLPHSSVC